MHSENMRRFLASVFTKFSYQIEHSKNQLFSYATYHVAKRW